MCIISYAIAFIILLTFDIFRSYLSLGSPNYLFVLWIEVAEYVDIFQNSSTSFLSSQTNEFLFHFYPLFSMTLILLLILMLILI